MNRIIRLLIFVGSLCLTAALFAQSAPPSQGYLQPVMVTEPSSSDVTPDSHPLSGGQLPGIGSWGPRRSTLTPSISVAETFDSNPLLATPSPGGYQEFTSLGGNLQWQQYLGRNTEFLYSGAVRYDTKARLEGYSQFTNAHGISISKSMRTRLWGLLLDDQAQYSQGSNFGVAGMEGMDSSVVQLSSLSNPQSTSNTLRPDLLLSQTILTAKVGRISNTALVELDGHLSSRSTATLTASYGLLHFNSDLLTDTRQASFVGGYNRSLTARDTVAVEGAFSRFTFQDSSVSISTEYFSLLYGRRISGRSSIEFGGGPQVTQLHDLPQDRTFVGWQGRGALRYRLHHLDLSVQAIRAVSGGAGVLTGAITDTGIGSLGVPLSRQLSLSLSAGVSRNEQLTSSQAYDTQFASFAVNRTLGRYTNLFFSYDLQRQTTATTCTGSACGNATERNVFGVGLSWAHRPIGIE